MQAVWAAALAAVLAGPMMASPVMAEGHADTVFAQAMAAHKAGDFATAAQGFRSLADGIHGDAQYNLAVLYVRGEGVLQSDRAAFYWGWMARIYGIAEAAQLIDILTPRLTEDARHEIGDRLRAELHQRVDGGDTRAMLGLARVYEELQETPDLQTAYAWRVIAATLGVADAALLRDATALMLDDDTRLSAQEDATRLFAAWCEKAGAEAPACQGLEVN